jgi:hypothetical protein
MKIQHLLGCSIIFIGQLASALHVPLPSFTKQELCGDLADLSCRIKTNVVVPKEKMEALKASSNAQATKLLQTQDNYYKRAMLEVSGAAADKSSGCQSATEKLEFSEQCTQRLQGWLGQAIYDNALGGSEAVNRKTEEDTGDIESQMAFYGWPEFNASSEVVRESFLSGFENKQNMDKIQTEMFPTVKSLVLKNIQANVKDEKMKQLMVDKINGINMSFAICGAEENKANAVPSMFQPNASYNLLTNQITFCKGVLLTKFGASPLSLAMILAHELAHSIDMCGMGIGPKSDSYGFRFKDGNIRDMQDQHPYASVLSCLRRPDSIEAKVRVDKRKGANFCNKSDQINESFCDWMATEVAVEYSKQLSEPLDQHFARALSPLCPKTKLPGFIYSEFDEHPPIEDRINKILAANPGVRSKMGCEAIAPAEKAHYCTANETGEAHPEADTTRAVQSLQKVSGTSDKSDKKFMVFRHHGKEIAFGIKTKKNKTILFNDNKELILSKKSSKFFSRQIASATPVRQNCKDSTMTYFSNQKTKKMCFSTDSKTKTFALKLSHYLNAVF